MDPYERADIVSNQYNDWLSKNAYLAFIGSAKASEMVQNTCTQRFFGPLEEWLEVLPKHFANWPLENRYTAVHVQKVLPANWKATQEAFAEAYHVDTIHAGSFPNVFSTGLQNVKLPNGVKAVVRGSNKNPALISIKLPEVAPDASAAPVAAPAAPAKKGKK